MSTIALILAGLSALVHVYIFWLEAFAWTRPRGLATFGFTPDEARITKNLAFNQGFYNLFLAIVTIVGIVASAAGHDPVGAALVIAGCGSMVAAGVVLLASSPSNARAAAVQLTAPALALLSLGISAL